MGGQNRPHLSREVTAGTTTNDGDYRTGGTIGWETFRVILDSGRSLFRCRQSRIDTVLPLRVVSQPDRRLASDIVDHT